jgi:hypothetical protein
LSCNGPLLHPCHGQPTSLSAAAGLSITAVIGFNSLRSYHTKLRQFLEETALDDFAITGRNSWHAPGKGE